MLYVATSPRIAEPAEEPLAMVHGCDRQTVPRDGVETYSDHVVMRSAEPLTLTKQQARRLLLARTGLGPKRAGGPAALSALLRELRCIQLDPLDPFGTNADLVAMARVQDVDRGDIYAEAHASGFEHFAKERCLLPAEAFPYYAAEAPRRPDFRLGGRASRLDAATLDAALEQVTRRGPLAGGDLDLGRVEALNWNGWKGTSSAARMALEVLSRRCKIVVSGRAGRDKFYDLPARHFPDLNVPACGEDEFARWAILQRVDAAGLLSRAAGIWWSSIARRELADGLVSAGELEQVEVAGVRSPLLTQPGAREAAANFELSDALRMLGPLDPVLWNRRLIAELFDFDYLWEVYKPATQRRWGWYVVPLLQGERLVGRLEGRVDKETLRITRVWEEARGSVKRRSLDAMLAEHATACGCTHFERPSDFD